MSYSNPVYDNQPATPTNPVEDETMLRQMLANIADKVVSASGLAKRVEELEARVKEQQGQIDDLSNELWQERRYHEETKAKLAEVEASLSHEKSVMTEVFAEVDRVKAEKDQAVRALEDFKQASAGMEQINADQARQIADLLSEVSTLREARARADAKIDKMLQALRD